MNCVWKCILVFSLDSCVISFKGGLGLIREIVFFLFGENIWLVEIKVLCNK